MHRLTKIFLAASVATVALTPCFAASDFLFRVPLYAAGEEAPLPGNLKAVSNALDFGIVAVSTGVGRTLTLLNSGGQPATASISVAGSPAYSVTPGACAGPVAAGASCELDIGFSPGVAGPLSGTLSIDVAGAVQTVSLAGVGGQAIGGLSSSALSFATTQVGDVTTEQTTTLTNSGNVPLQVSGVSFLSGQANFLKTNTCATALAPGGSCLVGVTFAPASSSATPFTAQLAIAYNGGTALLTATGTGKAASATLSSDQLTLQVRDTAAYAMTLKNTGISAITVVPPTASSITGASSVTFTGTTCGTSLASGATCLIQASFTPIVRTSVQPVFTVATSAGVLTSRPWFVSVDQSLSIVTSFAGTLTPINGTTRKVGTVKNNGIGIVTFDDAQPFYTSPGDYHLVSHTCPMTLDVGATCTVTIDFTPLTGGQQAGMLYAKFGYQTTAFAMSAIAASN